MNQEWFISAVIDSEMDSRWDEFLMNDQLTQNQNKTFCGNDDFLQIAQKNRQ
jgi:hypothetical protein